MGGAVKVAIRLEDGSVHSEVRWTNALNPWLHSPRLIDEPDALLREYLAQPSQWNTGDTTLTPDDYGLVVIDAVTKSIYSYQDYSIFGNTSATRIIICDDVDLACFQEFRNRGLLSAFDDDDNPTGHFKGETTLTVREEAVQANREKTFVSIVIDLSPWTLKQHEQYVPFETLEYLESEGFPVTEADKVAWAAWIEEEQKLSAEHG